MTNLKLPNLNHENLMAFQRPGWTTIAYETQINTEDGVTRVTHHRNQIAVLTQQSIHIDTAGWSSMTTLHRLDRILQDNRVPFRIARRKGSAILDMDLHVIARGFREAEFARTDDALSWRMKWCDVEVNHGATARV